MITLFAELCCAVLRSSLPSHYPRDFLCSFLCHFLHAARTHAFLLQVLSLPFSCGYMLSHLACWWRWWFVCMCMCITSRQKSSCLVLPVQRSIHASIHPFIVHSFSICLVNKGQTSHQFIHMAVGSFARCVVLCCTVLGLDYRI